MERSRWQRSVEELLAELRDTETVIRRAYSTVLELVAELEVRGAAQECGYRSIPELLKDVLRISRADAARRVRHAVAVTEVDLPSGGTLPAPLPLTGAALRDGAVTGDHLDVITRTLSNLPLHITPEQREAAEHSLVDAARRADPRTLMTFAGQVRAYLDQDGPAPTDDELAEPVNELRLITRRNGRMAFTGTPGEAGEKPHLIVTIPLHHLRTALVADACAVAAVPAVPVVPLDFSATTDPAAEPATGPGTANTRPTMSDDSRMTGAVAATADRAATPGGPRAPDGMRTPGRPDVPDWAETPGRTRAPDEPVTPGKVGTLDGAGALDAASARRLACDCKAIPAVLGSDSEVLDLGRAGYTVNHAIRRALILRDKGCTFPTCDRRTSGATRITLSTGRMAVLPGRTTLYSSVDNTTDLSTTRPGNASSATESRGSGRPGTSTPTRNRAPTCCTGHTATPSPATEPGAALFRRGPSEGAVRDDAGVVRVEGVRKRYRGGPVVLGGVDLVVEPGRPVAVRGANGSGKSTLLRVVAGCERPTGGRVVGRPRVVGYLPDRFPASALMSARAYLGHLAAIHGVRGRWAAAEAEELLGALGFTGDRRAPMVRLSKGNAQKVGLAQALSCGAGLLVLDEPWSGLDPGAVAAVNERLDAAVAGGALVLVSDHTGASARLGGVVGLRLAGGVVGPDGGGGPGDDVTVELGWGGDVAALVEVLPAVTRWWPVAGGVVLRLSGGDSDALLSAALGQGCSVRGVRRDAAAGA